MQHTLTAVIVTSTAALMAGGCGGGADARDRPQPKPRAAASVIEIVAPATDRGPLRFDKRRLTAKAGLIELRLANRDTRVHNIRIQKGERCCDAANDVGGTNTIDGGASTTARVQLESGRYWFLCSVNNHYNGEMGKMKGPLVVR